MPRPPLAVLTMLLTALVASGCAAAPGLAAAKAGGGVRAAAAPHPAMRAFQVHGDGRYLDALLDVEALAGDYLGTPQENAYQQTRGTVRSWVGDDAGALAAFDRINEPSTWSEPGADRTTARDAVEVVLAAAATRRVVMVNEAHHVPKHRAFTRSLLRGLKARGYRYLAAETFNDRPDLRTLKAPHREMGYYSVEPVFGELVREALALGFTLVAYESDHPGQDAPWPKGQNVRERGQASNLKERIFDRDPAAKVLVHAGYGHIQEGTFENGWVPMAAAFQELTGIDPLTIDQIHLDEGGPRTEAADYAPLLAHLRPSAPVVPFDAQGASFGAARQQYDLRVLHPRSIYQDGRPTWRRLGGERRALALPAAWRPALQARTGPLIAQALVPGEPEPRLPADQVVVPAKGEAPALMVGDRPLELRLVGPGGRILATARHGGQAAR